MNPVTYLRTSPYIVLQRAFRAVVPPKPAVNATRIHAEGHEEVSATVCWIDYPAPRVSAGRTKEQQTARKRYSHFSNHFSRLRFEAAL
jgi:hypothetical protein